MSSLKDQIPDSWRAVLADTLAEPYFAELESYVDGQYASATVYPPREDIFTALRLTPFEDVRALILGQDPYHGEGQAHGLAFSVRPGVKVPPSLRNIYKELNSDLGLAAPDHGNLEAWAKRGVLLLNAILTVRASEPGAHENSGWQRFTDAIISKVGGERPHVAFILWGGFARKKKKLIDKKRHTIIESAHPSPLSVKQFLGSKPFSKANAALEAHGQAPIDWSLPKTV